MHKKKILLTGASGTIGKEILNLLYKKKEHYEISLLLRDSKKNNKLIRRYRRDIKVFWGNLLNYEDVRRAVNGTDVVLHIAAVLPDVARIDSEFAYATNVGGTENIIKAINCQNVKPKIIYPSSVAIYGERRDNPIIRLSDTVQNDENDVYTDTKIKAETLIRNSGLNYLIFRVSYVASIDIIKLRPIMFYMPLDTPVEIIHAKDVALAMVNAIEKDDLWGQIFNLGGGKDCQTKFGNNLNDMLKIMGFGKDFLPNSAFATASFHCGWYDVTETMKIQNLLHFQKHNLQDFYAEVKKWIGIKRFLIPLVRPILRKLILRKSDFYKKKYLKNGN